MTAISDYVRMEDRAFIHDEYPLGDGSWVEPDDDIELGQPAVALINGGRGGKYVQVLAHHDEDSYDVAFLGYGAPTLATVAASDLRPHRAGRFAVLTYDEQGYEEFSYFRTPEAAAVYADASNGELEERGPLPRQPGQLAGRLGRGVGRWPGQNR